MLSNPFFFFDLMFLSSLISKYTAQSILLQVQTDFNIKSKEKRKATLKEVKKKANQVLVVKEKLMKMNWAHLKNWTTTPKDRYLSPNK